jgi:uncharacterized protein (DUF1501 family)
VSILRHDALLPDDDTGFRVFPLTQPGYATHAEQGAASAEARHGANLLALSDALAKLWTDLVALELQSRVLVLVYPSSTARDAERHRRPTPAPTTARLAGARARRSGSGSTGIPAAHGARRAGRLVPEIDFRRVYATVLERFLGADPDALLPGGPFALVDFLPA